MFKLTPAGSIPVCPNVGQSIAGILFLFLASFLAPCNANAQTISGVDLCDSEGGTWQPNFPGLSWTGSVAYTVSNPPYGSSTVSKTNGNWNSSANWAYTASSYKNSSTGLFGHSDHILISASRPYSYVTSYSCGAFGWETCYTTNYATWYSSRYVWFDHDAPEVAAINDVLNEDNSATWSAALYNYDCASAPSISLSGCPNWITEGSHTGNHAKFSINPPANYNGSGNCSYTVSFPGRSRTKTLNYNVQAVNDPPVANAQSVSTNEDTNKSITLTGSDIEGSALTYSIVSNPSHGTLSGSGNQRTYSPHANYHGSDSFTFRVNDGALNSTSKTVSITVNSVNDAPEAFSQNVTTDEDVVKEILLGASDDNNSDAQLTRSIVSQPTNGTLALVGNSGVNYTPHLNWYGSDSFTYRVNDGQYNSSTKTISITVTSVMDPFIADFTLNGGNGNPQNISISENGGTATAFSTEIPEEGIFNIEIIGTDGDGLEGYSISDAPNHGALTLEMKSAGELSPFEETLTLLPNSSQSTNFYATGSLEEVALALTEASSSGASPQDLILEICSPLNNCVEFGSGNDGFELNIEDGSSTDSPMDSNGSMLAIVSTCDDCTETVDLPFTFDFYGNQYDEISVSSNGVVWLGANSNAWCCQGATLPSLEHPNPSIHVFHTDLDPGQSGSITYNIVGSAPNRQVVISYNDVMEYGSYDPYGYDPYDPYGYDPYGYDPYGTGNAGVFINAQLVLNETDGVIHIWHDDINLNSHSATVGLNNPSSGESSVDLGSNQAQSISATDYHWTPLLADWLSDSGEGLYEFFSSDYIGLSGDGTWNFTLTNVNPNQSASFDFDLTLMGLSQPDIAVVEYVSDLNHVGDDEFTIQATDVHDNTANMVFPVMKFGVDDGETHFLSPASTSLTFQEDIDFDFELTLFDADGLSNQGEWNASSLSNAIFEDAGGICSDFEANLVNNNLEVSCKCSPPSHYSEGYHPDYPEPFIFLVTIYDEQGFATTQEYEVTLSQTADVTYIALEQATGGNVTSSNTRTLSSGTSEPITIQGTEDTPLSLDFFFDDNDGLSLPPFENPSSTETDAQSGDATTSISNVVLGDNIMTSGSHNIKTAVLDVEPNLHKNGNIEVLLSSMDRFGAEVIVPLTITLDQVNDPVLVSLDCPANPENSTQQELSGTAPAATGVWNIELQVEEDVPLQFALSAVDDADGIGNAPLSMLNGAGVSASSPHGSSPASFAISQSLQANQVYTPAFEFPTEAQIAAGENHDYLTLVLEDEDGNKIEVNIDFIVSHKNDGDVSYTGESAIDWYEDAFVKRTIQLIDPDGLQAKDVHITNGSHGTAELVRKDVLNPTTLEIDYIYSPDAEFHGMDNISISVKDDQGYEGSEFDISISVQSLNDPLTLTAALQDKCDQNDSIVTDADCDSDGGDIDQDGICDNEDDCIDVNCDGLCDYNFSLANMQALEDDSLLVQFTFGDSPSAEDDSYAVQISTCGAPDVPEGWELIASTDSALYLQSLSTYDNWYAARTATEAIYGGRLVSISNSTEANLLSAASGWTGEFKSKGSNQWQSVSGSTPYYSENESCPADSDCFGFLDNGSNDIESTTNNIISDRKAIMELSFLICSKNGRNELGTASNSWRYIPDFNYSGSNRFSIAVEDQEGYVEFRHFDVEVQNTEDATMFGGNLAVASEEDLYSRGNIYALDFDGLQENAFEEIADLKAVSLVAPNAEDDSDGNVQVMEETTWLTKGELNYLENFEDQDDPSNHRGFFYTEGMTFWAPLDNHLTDTISNNVVAETSPLWSSDRFGNTHAALRLNESTPLIIIPGDQLSVDGDPRSLSFSFWFTLESSLNDGHTLFSNAGENVAADEVFEIIKEDQLLEIHSGSEIHQLKVHDHSWNHIVVTFDKFDSTLTGFMNGEKEFEAFNTTPLKLPTSDFALGGKIDGSSTWDGVIDDIAIWNRALTFGEAASMHKQEGARYLHTPILDDYDRSSVTFLTNNEKTTIDSRFDGQMIEREMNVIAISHNAVADYGCTDPDGFNFSTRAIVDTSSFLGFAPAVDSVRCEFEGPMGNRIWTPDEDLSKMTASLAILVDSDDDGVLDENEISGCMDPTACNYNPLATDDYPNYSFLDYLHIGATDSTRLYISRKPVEWDAAIEDADSLGGHIATIHSIEEAMTVATRTGFADTIALAPADTLYISGYKFITIGEFGPSRYYVSMTDSLSMYDWEHSPQVRWPQLQSNLVVINSSEENDALTTLLDDAGLDRAWLGLTDDDKIGIGEGNWTFLRDSSLLGSYTSWAEEPVDTDPNFLSKKDIPDNEYDYAQLWTLDRPAEAGFGTHTTGVNHPIASGEWVMTNRDGFRFIHDDDGFDFISSNAHLVLELPATFCTPTFNFAVADSNGYDLTQAACPTKDVPRITMIEIPRDEYNDCRYPVEECEHCLFERDELDQLPITYIGRTDSSKYYISTDAVSMESLLSEEDYAFGQLSEHLVRIGGQQENDEIVELFKTSAASSVEHLWLGVSDSASDGTWRDLRDGQLAVYTNWDSDENFDGRSDALIQGHRYGRYDYAQMWLNGGDRRWHDENGNEVVAENEPAPGAWVAMPSYGVIQSGAFPAHVLFEFPHDDFEVIGGYDTNTNEVCDHEEDYECLDVFSDVSLEVSDGEIAMMFNGHSSFDASRVYLMGWGTYTLFDVPAETPVTILGDHPEFISVTGDSSTAITGSIPAEYATGENTSAHFFHGDVEITISGEFGNASVFSVSEGMLRTHRKLQSHRPSTEYICAGICISDDNFNNICDEFEGCMDENACNYKATATYDDGSCVDAWNCTGCRDESACNYNINATKDGSADQVYIDLNYEFLPEGAVPESGQILYTPPGLGSVGMLIPAYCVYKDSLSECEFCSGDVDGSGVVLGGDTLIDGTVWCIQEIGCSDPNACDFNEAAEPNNPYAQSDCLLYPTSGTCEYCNGAQDGTGFVISGDEDNDGVCDVVDANRRIPLTLMAYTGTSFDGLIEIEGPYDDLSWDFKVPGIHKRELVIYENFTSIQFGQEFNLEVADAGNFETFLTTPTAENMPPGIVNETVNIFSLQPVFKLDSIKGISLQADPADPNETSHWIGKSGSDTRTAQLNIANPDMLGSFQVFDGDEFVEVNYAKDNLAQSNDHTERLLAVATFSTDASIAGEPIGFRSVPLSGTYFGDTLLSWSPTHYQEYRDNQFGTDLASLGVNSTLARIEDVPLHLAGADWKGPGTRVTNSSPGITGSESPVDYYHFTASRASLPKTLADLPYSAIGAQLAQPRTPSAVGSLTGTMAWLDGRLSSSNADGKIGGSTATLFWHWGSNPNAENMLANTLSNGDWVGHVNYPLLGEEKNGPGFMLFPHMQGNSGENWWMTLDTWDEATLHFKNYTGTENGVLGTAYIISENPISFNKWYYRYRNLALVPNSGELSFIESGANTEFLGQDVTKRDRYWLGIRKASNGWVPFRNTGDTDVALEWAASSGFPDGLEKEGLYDYRYSNYAQLMTNRHVPIITGAGRGKSTIADADLKMVPVTQSGKLWLNKTNTTYGSGGTRVQYLGSYSQDPSALYEQQSNNSIDFDGDGFPVGRDNNDMIFWESASNADLNGEMRGWDIQDVSSYYYWIKDNGNRNRGEAHNRALALGGDLASFNAKGYSQGAIEGYLMRRATVETLRPYTVRQRYLAGRSSYSCGFAGWETCHRNIYRYRNVTKYQSISSFVNTWSGLLKNENHHYINEAALKANGNWWSFVWRLIFNWHGWTSSQLPVAGYADGTKVFGSDGALTQPNYTGRWARAQPDASGSAIQYWRSGSNFTWDDASNSTKNDAFAFEAYNYGGLGSAYAILEQEVPDNQGLAAAHGKFMAADTNRAMGAILELPFERVPELANWTPIGEGTNSWFYQSNQKLTFEAAQLAAEKVGGALMTLNENGATDALKRWSGNGWIGLYQDTTDQGFDEPFGGWKFADGSPSTGVPWANNAPNNGVQDTNGNGFIDGNETSLVEENHAEIASVLEEVGSVRDVSKYNNLSALVSIPKERAPRVQLAYSANAISENGANYLEQAYQLEAEGQLIIGSEVPSGTSDVNTGIEHVKAVVSTPESNDQLELWLEFDPDGDEEPSDVTSEWMQLLAPGNMLPAGESQLTFKKGGSGELQFDRDLSDGFDGVNARSYWRLWAFDSESGHRWQLKRFEIFFNAPKIIEVEAAADVIVGTSNGVSDGVTLREIGVSVKNIYTGEILSLHPNSTFNLYVPGQSDAIEFTQGGLSELTQSLNGATLNGKWECTLLQALDVTTAQPILVEDPATGNMVDGVGMNQFTMEFLIPPGLVTGPQPYLTESGDLQFVADRIRLGGGVDLPPTISEQDDVDDINLTTISIDSDYEEGVNEENIFTQHSHDNVVALLPQNPLIEAGIEDDILVEVGNVDVHFEFQIRDENTLYYVSTETMSYDLAQRAAAMAGGHLVVPSNDDEESFIKLQGVHGWTGLIDADTNQVWVPITGEYIDPSWDLMSHFSVPPLHSEDLTTADHQHATMTADGLSGQGIDAVAHATLEIGKAGTPALTWAPITPDNLFFDIYDPANDKHYVGARIGDAEVLEGQDHIGSQGRIWRASESGDLLSFTNGDEDGESEVSDPSIDGFTLIAATDSSNYFSGSDANLTYLQAQEVCASQGGRLATLETPAENDLIKGQAQGHIGLWKDNNGIWMWATGATPSYTDWSPTDIENPNTDVAVVMTSAGWDRKSNISVSRAICEMEALGDLTVNGDAYMVPTSSNTFPLYYESNSSFVLPTIVLLDSAGYESMDGPSHFGEEDWILASQTRRRTPAWEVPVLLVPDPLTLEELYDNEHGIYTAQGSTDGVLGDIQQRFGTYNLGNIQLSNLWNTETEAINGTPLTLVDASVHPDSVGGAENLLSGYNAGEFYLTPPPANHGLYREGSDVKVFNANTLKTKIELSPSGDFNDHEIHASFPITAPKFNSETLSDLSYGGADAINNGLPYWGVPNGVPAYAEMYVRVRNELTGVFFDTTMTSDQNPLLLKNCPHLMNDSIHMTFKVSEMNNSDGQLKFTGGDPVVISASVLWMTEGRRTMLWTDRDLVNNTLTMCTDIAPDFVMQSDPQEEQYLTEVDRTITDADGTVVNYLADDSVGVSQVTLVWNHSAASYSSGGSMYLQRRNYEDYGGTQLGWQYATGDVSKPWSFNQEEAKPFYNVDADFNGNLDPIFYTDSTLFHNLWSCETAEYRVKQDMCGDIFYTPSIQVSIQGSVSDPWKYIDEITDGGRGL